MNKKELKDCPFCGSAVDWCRDNHTVHDLGQDCHYITCERCGEFNLNLIDNFDFPELYKSIADQWNTRTSIEISKLEELIDTTSSWAGDTTESLMVDIRKLIDEAKGE